MNIELCNETKIVISIQDSLYSSAVIHKCFYWYSSKFDIDITKKENSFIVTIMNIPADLDREALLSTIRKNLIDFNTREIINKETSDIRTLLVAKAFANEDDFEEPPMGLLDDTVGFSPFDFK
ncbi:MAG: His-Xaa-Ser system protein HxsD [Gelidibacter sp.]